MTASKQVSKILVSVRDITWKSYFIYPLETISFTESTKISTYKRAPTAETVNFIRPYKGEKHQPIFTFTPSLWSVPRKHHSQNTNPHQSPSQFVSTRRQSLWRSSLCCWAHCCLHSPNSTHQFMSPTMYGWQPRLWIQDCSALAPIENNSMRIPVMSMLTMIGMEMAKAARRWGWENAKRFFTINFS